MINTRTFSFPPLYSIYQELFQFVDTLKITKQTVANDANCALIPIDDFNRIDQAIVMLETLVEQLSTIDAPVENAKQFWSHIRHDLRTPINVINGYSEILLEDLAGSDADIIKENLHTFLTINAKLLKSIEKIVFDTPLDNAPASVFTVSHTSENTINKNHLSSTILIVEDQEMNRDTLKRRLVKEGYRVVEAADGYKAFDLLNNQTVDLILLDLIMPGLNGYDVLIRLKQDQNLRQIPVIMISAISEIDQIVTCIEAGADDYLTKPFDPVLLRARINSCLDRKYLHAQEKETLLKIINAQKILETAIESIDNGFILFDEKGECALTNTAFRKLYPGCINHNPLTYERFLQYCVEEKVYVLNDPEQWRKDRLKLTLEKHIFIEQYGEKQWLEITAHLTPAKSQVFIHKDITDTYKEGERLSYLANHDALTGLANRKLFHEFLTKFVDNATASPFAVFYIDLDGFKKVNDTHGHSFGDDLLKYITEQFKQVVRSKDIIARLGGDEFAILLPDIHHKDDAALIASRILKDIKFVLEKDGKRAEFGLSIGIALFPTDAQTLPEILACADMAMYTAKRNGKGQYRFFEKTSV